MLAIQVSLLKPAVRRRREELACAATHAKSSSTSVTKAEVGGKGGTHRQVCQHRPSHGVIGRQLLQGRQAAQRQQRRQPAEHEPEQRDAVRLGRLPARPGAQSSPGRPRQVSELSAKMCS